QVGAQWLRGVFDEVTARPNVGFVTIVPCAIPKPEQAGAFAPVVGRHGRPIGVVPGLAGNPFPSISEGVGTKVIGTNPGVVLDCVAHIRNDEGTLSRGRDRHQMATDSVVSSEFRGSL